ncbi:hypothetical protein VB715_18600 [Crocosphaera sp. UHCC 0190]|uniref:hypothetical protein n=1 Tax=Crocosphaera sp. UHCC 0190 TaxID=3110246 RepID=UPI002B20BFEB|nr:hypothetical protein [Crocosphaera sp. UHCC 0190]MEA5511786.1 hypothetical protein [Crocosphaera sp. UHCC 0190]
MVQQIIKTSPHGSFKVTQLCENVVICEDIHNKQKWGNETDTKPAFTVYVGCKRDEASGYIKTFQTFYRIEWCEVRKPKYLNDFEVEIKIPGMQRETDTYAFGLDYLVD